jgi:drug/metabolite transporter (DMT)-like permease
MNAQPTPERRRRNAVLALLAVTVIWGWTFVWMKQGLNAADRLWDGRGAVAAIGLMLTLRFGLAAVVLAIFVPRSRRGLDAGVHVGGFLLGAVLLGGFVLQMFGLQGVSPAVSAFLTSLYVLFTALLTAMISRRPVRLPLALGCLLATFGAGWINGPPQISFGLSEWLTVACALLFAVHILVTDKLTKVHEPLPMTLVQFVWVTLGGVVTLAIGMTLEGAPGFADLVALTLDMDFAVPLVLSSIVATVIAISLMNTFQRDLEPVRAAILYAIEPVWAALIALAMGLADANAWLFVGGGALLAGNLIAELRTKVRASAVPGGGA